MNVLMPLRPCRPLPVLRAILPGRPRRAGRWWLALVLTFAMAKVLADDSVEPERRGPPPSIGLGVLYERLPYRGLDPEWRPIPVAIYESRWFSIRGPQADLKLLATGPVSWRLRARYAFDGYDAADSPNLAGMGDRKDSLWLGPAASWRQGPVEVTADLLGDASGNSKGLRAQLQASYRQALGRHALTPRIGIDWLDRDAVAYYYGVTAAEATPGRPAYAGGSAARIGIGLRFDLTVARHHGVFVDAEARAVGRAIHDSPLVDRRTELKAMAGYLYRF